MGSVSFHVILTSCLFLFIFLQFKSGQPSWKFKNWIFPSFFTFLTAFVTEKFHPHWKIIFYFRNISSQWKFFHSHIQNSFHIWKIPSFKKRGIPYELSDPPCFIYQLCISLCFKYKWLCTVDPPPLFLHTFLCISMSQTVLPAWDIFNRTKIQSINLNIFFHYDIDRVQLCYKRICFHSFFYATGYCCCE